MKSSFTLKLLPSLLIGVLGLSACQDSSSTVEGDNSKVVDSNSESDGLSDTNTVNSISPVVADAPKSTEQQMVDTLSHYRWTLANATGADAKPIDSLTSIKEQVTLIFTEYQGQNAVSYSVGCNTMNAAFQLQANTLISEDSMSTKMSCEDLNIAENQLDKLMKGESQLSMVNGESPMLTQKTSDSATLVWQGKMTAQAKYNNKGETVFWAVKADRKPCTGNSVQMCLQVQPVTYDERGIRISEGKFTEFNGVIDGYKHDNTSDEVLRLQRFKTDIDTVVVDNTESEYAYVLDTVIESSVTK